MTTQIFLIEYKTQKPTKKHKKVILFLLKLNTNVLSTEQSYHYENEASDETVLQRPAALK